MLAFNDPSNSKEIHPSWTEKVMMIWFHSDRRDFWKTGLHRGPKANLFEKPGPRGPARFAQNRKKSKTTTFPAVSGVFFCFLHVFLWLMERKELYKNRSCNLRKISSKGSNGAADLGLEQPSAVDGDGEDDVVIMKKSRTNEASKRSNKKLKIVECCSPSGAISGLKSGQTSLTHCFWYPESSSYPYLMIYLRYSRV